LLKISNREGGYAGDGGYRKERKRKLPRRKSSRGNGEGRPEKIVAVVKKELQSRGGRDG